MALQSSGAISLQDIENEFGGSHPIALSEYYGVSSGIPGSGQISLSQFYGASAGPVIERYFAMNGENDFVAHWYYFFEHPYGGGGESAYSWQDGSTNLSAYYDGTGTAGTAAYWLETQTYYEGSNSIPWYLHGTPNHKIKQNCPFPAVIGAVGGWYYYDLRGDSGQYGEANEYEGNVFVASAYFYGNRTTSSTYPH